MNQRDRYTCEQVFQRLDDYIDRELTPEEAALIQRHLEICEWCAKTYDFQASVIENLRGRLQRVKAPPDLLAKVSRVLDFAPGE